MSTAGDTRGTDEAARVLLDAADNAQLLVVGNTRRGAWVSAITGSLAHQCVYHAPLPGRTGP